MTGKVLRSVDLIRVGMVTRAHGIKGEIKVLPDFGSPDDFRNYRQIVLEGPGAGREYKVSRSRTLARVAVLQLEGVGDRNGAEALAGSEVLIDRQALPDLAAGDYYWHDLVGLRVETASGRMLGRVEGLLATEGHDILVVLDGPREYLIPLRKEFLSHVDLAAGVLTVAEVPGLFEIND